MCDNKLLGNMKVLKVSINICEQLTRCVETNEVIELVNLKQVKRISTIANSIHKDWYIAFSDTNVPIKLHKSNKPLSNLKKGLYLSSKLFSN